jgi:hypothetical protein
MVTIFPLIREMFVESGHQLLPTTALRLRQPLCCLVQFLGMGDLLAIGQREQVMKTRIYPYRTMTDMGNGWGLRVDKEAQIPARRSFDDATTFGTPCRNVLSVESHLTYARHMDARPMRGVAWIREGNARKLISLPFELRALGELVKTPLPGRIRHVEHPLQCMTRDAELFAVVREQIVERFARV